MAAETFNAPCLPFTAMFPDVAGYRYSNDCGRRRFFQPTEFDVSKVNTLLANQAAFQQLQAGVDPRRIAEDWRDGVEKFMQVRSKYLIYQDK